MAIFRDKPSVGTDMFNDDMVTDDLETAAKQHDDTIGELGLVLLRNNVHFLLCSILHLDLYTCLASGFHTKLQNLSASFFDISDNFNTQYEVCVGMCVFSLHVIYYKMSVIVI